MNPKPYTVIVLYPAPLRADRDNPATYIATVEAETPREAMRTGAREAMNSQPNSTRYRFPLPFWTALAVFEGHHRALEQL